MQKEVYTGSTSKWPAAMMLAGAVADGTILSLDDPVHRYLKWWTISQQDPRSRVTLRHLLTFTSGFGDGNPGDNAELSEAPALQRKRSTRREVLLADAPPSHDKSDPLACMGNQSSDFEACAKTIYTVVGGEHGELLYGEPGHVYSYNSNHLQLAAVVVTSASGLSIQEVIHKYLRVPYDMPSTSCSGTNPILAGCFVTTAHDYGNFLAGVLGHSVLSKSLVDESEKDATPFLSNWYTLYGNYAFGHFLWCFDSIWGMTKKCRHAQVHCDPGAFGFIPMVDRRLDYYIQVVAFEASRITYPRSGIPEYLMQVIKPLADAIMTGNDIRFSAEHATPAFQTLSLADLNYISDCYLHPEHCIDGDAIDTDVDVAFAGSLQTFSI